FIKKLFEVILDIQYGFIGFPKVRLLTTSHKSHIQSNTAIWLFYFILFSLPKCFRKYSAVTDILSSNKSSTVPANNTFPPYLHAPSPISIIQSACAITSRLCSMTIKVLLFSTKLFIKSNSFSVSLGCSPVPGSSRTIILLECFISLVNLRRCLYYV